MLQLQYRPLADLTKLPGNPRVIRDHQFRILCESLRRNPDYFEARPLLGESHLAIHTFPDFGTTYLELSSCMRDKYVLFLGELESFLDRQTPAILTS